MNNNVHLNSARGYYGPPHMVMPNCWTPWQPQALIYSLRSLPAWAQHTIPQAISTYVPYRGMTYGAAPQVMQSVQVPCDLPGKASESCLFGLRDHMNFKPGYGVEMENIMCTAAPWQQAPAQAHCGPEAQSGGPNLFGRHNLTSADAANEVKAELDRDRTSPARRGWTRKRERAPGMRNRERVPAMRKRRRTKADSSGSGSVKREPAGQEGVVGDAELGHSATSGGRKRQSKAEHAQATPKSHLHERIAESVRVYHRLGDKPSRSSPSQLQKPTHEAASTHRLTATSGTHTPPPKPERGRRKEGEFELQDCVDKETFPGVSTPGLAPRCRSGNTPVGSAPQLARERSHGSTPTPPSQAKFRGRPEHGSCRWPTSPALPRDGRSSSPFPTVLEESVPIQPWQREEREAMKMAAQKQRQQAARVTRKGLDYAAEKEKYPQGSGPYGLGPDTFLRSFLGHKKHSMQVRF